MDLGALIQATAHKAEADGRNVPPQEVERVLLALFGTVEHPGTIAEGLRSGETVVLGGFGDLHLEGSRPVLRPGHALIDYVQGAVG